MRQITYLWNRQLSEISKIIFSKRWSQNYKVFNFESFIPLALIVRKGTPTAKDRVNELNRERGAVVGELHSGSWQGNDDRPKNRPAYGPCAALSPSCQPSRKWVNWKSSPRRAITLKQQTTIERLFIPGGMKHHHHTRIANHERVFRPRGKTDIWSHGATLISFRTVVRKTRRINSCTFWENMFTMFLFWWIFNCWVLL